MDSTVTSLAGVTLGALLLVASARAEAPKVTAEPYTWATAPMGGGEVIGDPRIFGLVYVAARGVAVGIPGAAGNAQ